MTGPEAAAWSRLALGPSVVLTLVGVGSGGVLADAGAGQVLAVLGQARVELAQPLRVDTAPA